MDLGFTINGIALKTGQDINDNTLQQAGLTRLPAWRCLLRRLPGGFRYWEARNPRVLCFDGRLNIFACRDRYLDNDRKWGTELLLGESESRIQWLDIRITDGVYASGNYFNSFIDAASERFGQPERKGQRLATWVRDSLQIEARLSADALDAVFHVLWQPNGCEPSMQHADNTADEVTGRSR